MVRFQDTLLDIDPKTIPVPGTDWGARWDEGFRALDKNERQKLLVVLTDGEDLEKGRAVRVAEDLAKKGVTVFTIGIGTPAVQKSKSSPNRAGRNGYATARGKWFTAGWTKPTFEPSPRRLTVLLNPLGATRGGLAKFGSMWRKR